MTKPWTVAFVGAGNAKADNVKALLNEWLPEHVSPPVIPAVIPTEHQGLFEVAKWLEHEFGAENVDELDQDALLGRLMKAHEDEGVDAYLVYVPAEEDDPYADVVANALRWGITVLDLTKGLYPIDPAFGKATPDSTNDTEAVERTLDEESPLQKPLRGKPRQPANPDAPSKEEVEESMAREDPPWEEDDEDEGQVLPGLKALMERAAPWDKPKVSVELSQDTIDLFMAALASFAADIAVAARPQPKEKKEPYWLNEAEGTYRKRGQGRGRKGETAVDLTDEQVEDLQNRGLL